MSAHALEVSHLAKSYRLGRTRSRYRTIQEDLGQLHRGLIGRLRRRYQPKPEFWALDDVSFDLMSGEALGIIGRNGAGKSTLLKILARVTEPTRGRATIRGRVGSLLEVGTGFHPELTGRENIYLSGAILGMRRRDIDARFDEIVEFAEVAQFIDTPVKQFSSGMHLRLAFSVAAHLEPEVLLVDEVLAVGDASFQKKCLGRMNDVAHEGRTVLFVSHQMASVQNLCSTGLLLANGRVAAQGSMSEVIDKYLASAVGVEDAVDLSTYPHRDGSGKLRFSSFSVEGPDGSPGLLPGRPATFKMTLESAVQGLSSEQVVVAFALSSRLGERLIEFHTKYDPGYLANVFEFGKVTSLTCTVADLPIKPGEYFLSLYADVNNELGDRLRDIMQVEVKPADYYGTGQLPLSSTQGWLLLKQRWSRVP